MEQISINNLLAALLLCVQQKPKIETSNFLAVQRFVPIQRDALDKIMLPHVRGMYINDNTRAGFWSRLISAAGSHSREAFEAGMGREPDIAASWIIENIRDMTYQLYMANGKTVTAQMDEGVIKIPDNIKAGESVSVNYTIRSGTSRPGNRKSRRQGKG